MGAVKPCPGSGPPAFSGPPESGEYGLSLTAILENFELPNRSEPPGATPDAQAGRPPWEASRLRPEAVLLHEGYGLDGLYGSSFPGAGRTASGSYIVFPLTLTRSLMDLSATESIPPTFLRSLMPVKGPFASR